MFINLNHFACGLDIIFSGWNLKLGSPGDLLISTFQEEDCQGELYIGSGAQLRHLHFQSEHLTD